MEFQKPSPNLQINTAAMGTSGGALLFALLIILPLLASSSDSQVPLHSIQSMQNNFLVIMQLI